MTKKKTMFERTKIWVTKDGRRLGVRQLTDDHLVNVIQFLNEVAFDRRAATIKSLESCLDALRNCYRATPCSGIADTGREVRRQIENFNMMTLDEWLTEYIPIYPSLCREVVRRNWIKLRL